MCTLESERLILRPPRHADIQSMTVWLSDYDVARMTARVPYPFSEGDAEAFLAHAPEYRFVIQRRSDGVFLGMTGLHAEDGYEFGYWRGKPFWGLAMPPRPPTGWCVSPSRRWALRLSMPAGSTTIRPRAMFWPSWGRAITVRRCAIAGRGAGRSCAMTCC